MKTKFNIPVMVNDLFIENSDYIDHYQGKYFFRIKNNLYFGIKLTKRYDCI